MQNLDNKVKLPELPSGNISSPVPQIPQRERTYSKILVAAFCVFVAIVLVVGIFVNSYLDTFMYNRAPNDLATPNLENAHWKVRTSTNTGDSITLELKSSIGNLRSYEGVKAYGISSTGKFLAMTSARGLEIVDLAENTTQAVNTPFDIAGDQGEIIAWSNDDDYFAIPVFNSEDNAAHLLVFSQNGTSVEDLTPNLSYIQDDEGNVTMYPVFFSPKEDYILVRNFNETDASTSIVNNKAVILTALDTKGRSVWEYDARDTSRDTEVLYYWSADGNYVYYAVVPETTVINYANNNLFNKVLFEISN